MCIHMPHICITMSLQPTFGRWCTHIVMEEKRKITRRTWLTEEGRKRGFMIGCLGEPTRSMSEAETTGRCQDRAFARRACQGGCRGERRREVRRGIQGISADLLNDADRPEHMALLAGSTRGA